MVKMTLRPTAMLLVVLLAGCFAAPEKTADENRKAAETNTSLGRQYMERGDYEIALEKLKRAIAFDKTYAPAHTMLGILYETIGDTAAAGSDDGDEGETPAEPVAKKASAKKAPAKKAPAKKAPAKKATADEAASADKPPAKRARRSA